MESMVTVLTTMAMVEIKAGKPCVKSHQQPMGEVTGLIDLSGSTANGSLAITFTEPAILDITERMLGEKLSAIDETVVDVVGEITNMITGSAKRIYSEQGLDFDLTLPKTRVGREEPLQHTVEGTTFLMPFSTAAGDLYLEACFN
jgi:chemotaxis protein CheX